mgnify:CR=1 FL=1
MFHVNIAFFLIQTMFKPVFFEKFSRSLSPAVKGFGFQSVMIGCSVGKKVLEKLEFGPYVTSIASSMRS